MGWDAFSEPFATVWGFNAKPGEQEGDRAWDDAVKELRDKGLMMDGLLKHGGLDVSTCGKMLERATGCSVYGEPWTPEIVKVLAETAEWDFEVDPRHEWAKESARVFLTHCAKLGRGVSFSW